MNNNPNRGIRRKKKKMNGITTTTTVAVLVALGLSMAAWAAEPPKPATPPDGALRAGTIGYRNDGTGVWPDDCAPVTKWQEWDFRTDKDEKGRPKDVPDKANPVNIVWKTPLKSDCNGGMILVKGKLFLLMDRGGYRYATEWEPDFVGSRLVCMDPQDGKVLWQKDLDHLGSLPPADAEKARKDVMDYYQWWTRTYGPYARWYEAARMHSGPPVKTNEDKQAYTVAAKEAIAAGVPVPPTYEELQASAEWSKVARTYVQRAWIGLREKLFSDRAAQHTRLVALGYPPERWFGQASFIGVNMATPVSDGERIWFTTGHYDAFCVDLDGQVVWSTWIKEARPQGLFGAPAVPSPILTQDRLIGIWGDNGNAWLRGLDRQTGKVVWSAKPGNNWASMEKLIVPVGNTGKSMEVVWHGSDGDVYRASDGKKLLEKIGGHATGRPQGVAGNILVINNERRITYAAALVAVRFTAENEDTLKAEVLWMREDLAGGGSTIHKGLVYAHRKERLELLELTTGKTVSKVEKLPICIWHFSSLAGGYLFGFDDGGAKCLVASVGKEPKVVAVNRLDKANYGLYRAFNEGGQPFFSGNRMFYRSYSDVYCIGDKTQPMRLSKEHQ